MKKILIGSFLTLIFIAIFAGKSGKSMAGSNPLGDSTYDIYFSTPFMPTGTSTKQTWTFVNQDTLNAFIERNIAGNSITYTVTIPAQ